MEEWISLNEYRRRYKIGYDVALQLIYNKEVEYQKTDTGRYKIKISGSTVSRDLYENEKKRRIAAEAKIDLLRKALA